MNKRQRNKLAKQVATLEPIIPKDFDAIIIGNDDGSNKYITHHFKIGTPVRIESEGINHYECWNGFIQHVSKEHVRLR